MATSNLTISSSISGVSYSGTIASDDYGVATHLSAITLPAAKVGALTTRTDDNTGTLTMNTGHGLSTGKIDVYWNVGGVKGCRRNMDGTVTGDSIAIDGGSGDVLPADESAITAVAPSTETITINADNLKMFAANINTDAHCSMSVGTVSGSYTEGAAIELNDGDWGRTRIWESNTGGTNPLDAANTFTTIKISQGGTTTATFKASFAGE
jgi:hypothetical protein